MQYYVSFSIWPEIDGKHFESSEFLHRLELGNVVVLFVNFV